MPRVSVDETKKILKDFGVDATDAEVASLSGMESGPQALAALAQYAQTKANQANDPLHKVMDAQKAFVDAQQAYAAGDRQTAAALYDKLQSTLKEAPQLFGNLTPDQIDQYTAPLAQKFKEADATTQTGNAARGLAGSSVEANARAEQGRIYKENLLSTGLNVGMTQQQAVAKAIQDEINRRTNLVGNATGAAATGLSLENVSGGGLSNNLSLLSSLPPYLQAYVSQAMAAERAANPNRGILGTMQDISTGVNLTGNILGGISDIGRKVMGSPGSAGLPAPASAMPSIAGNMGSTAGGGSSLLLA